MTKLAPNGSASQKPKTSAPTPVVTKIIPIPKDAKVLRIIAARAAKTVPPEILPPQKAKRVRDHSAERIAAQGKRTDRVAQLAVDRFSGKLGEEAIRIAQALVYCGLPVSATKERQVSRSARIGKYSTVEVTITAAVRGVDLPYGRDRDLLHWLVDRGIRAGSAFVSWESAIDYLRETGKVNSGENYRTLRKQWERLSGVVIAVVRDGKDGKEQTILPFIEKSFMPKSIQEPDSKAPAQLDFPELKSRYGFLLNQRFFSDAQTFNAAIPRELWLQRKGSIHVQDLMTFFIVRCTSARSETIMPWAELEASFPNNDSNKRRFRMHIREAIKALTEIWREVKIREVPQGVWFDISYVPMLGDDPTKKRIRPLLPPTAPSR